MINSLLKEPTSAISCTVSLRLSGPGWGRVIDTYIYIEKVKLNSYQRLHS